MRGIKKAVIPAAGLGTRFFPATKTVPKEMLPIIDKPAILYVIEEAMHAGIEDIILIQGRGKTAIEDFFDVSYELEDKLIKEGKQNLVDSINEIRSKINIVSVRQKYPLGLGHAIYCAKPFLSEEPFAVLLGDEISVPESLEKNPTRELIQLYEKYQMSAVTVLRVPQEEVSKYGVIQFDPFEKDIMRVRALFEKPKPQDAPSNFVLPGRYVLSQEIFEPLSRAQRGVNGEIQLTDSLDYLARTKGMLAVEARTQMYDTGDKLGLLIANIELALRRPELASGLLSHLKKMQGDRR